jgi:multicomponent Na+:H+ antiporter subunit B
MININRFLKLLLLLSFVSVFYGVIVSFHSKTEPSALASHYIQNAVKETGSINAVTSIVVTYRGFDTLGEVTILFLTAAIIGFFLKGKNEDSKERVVRESSEFLKTASKFLMPLVFLLGVYIFVNGHLSPGGGFPGGAAIASGVLLSILANPLGKLRHSIMSSVESVAGIFYVLAGVAGLVVFGAAHFLDASVLPFGKAGNLFSAGLIPVIYAFVGLKVGAELSSILASMQESQEEAK